MDSLRGHLLIASPHLSDPNFRQTVVLLVEHHDEGALGIVLNRPSTMTLNDMWSQLGNAPLSVTHQQQVIYFGGPVEGHIFCLHAHRDASESEVVPGVYLANNPELIRVAIRAEADPCRVFWGYAGWGEGQLDAELRFGGWLLLPASSDLVFRDDLETLWKSCVSLAGEELLRSSLHLHRFPQDPELN